MKIFVSYSRTDAGHFAQKIHRDLSKEGYNVFIDVDSIRAGDKWSNIIEENISKCDIFVVILTPSSLKNITYEHIKWNLGSYQGIEFDDKYDLALKLYRRIEEDAQNNNEIPNEIKKEVIYNEPIDITSSKEDSYDKDTLHNKGDALYDLGKYNEAITWYDKALAVQ